eukprot:243566-Rhodomonas_salina.1
MTYDTPNTIALVQGVRYYVRVRAENTLDVSNYSDSVSRDLNLAPGPPNSVNLSVAGNLSLQLDWAAPLDLGLGAGQSYPLDSFQYSIYFQKNANQSAGDLFSVSASSTELVLDRLVKGTTYYISVRAQNDALQNGGYGDWYNHSAGDCSIAAVNAGPATCGILVVDFPSAPQSVTFEQNGNLAIQAVWSRPADTGPGDSTYSLNSYQVQVVDSVGTIAYDSSLAETVLNVTVGGLTVAEYYRVQIRGINHAGNGDWSTFVSSIALLLPAPPSTVVTAWTKVLASGAVITVSFPLSTQTGLGNDTWPLLRYEVVPSSPNSTNPEGTTCFVPGTISLDRTVNSTEIGNLTKGCTYSFAVRSVNEAGTGNSTSSAFRLAIGTPSAPLNLAVQAVYSGQLDLEWDLPADTGGFLSQPYLVDRYKAEASLDASFSSVFETKLTKGQERSISFFFLQEGVRVYCRVFQLNEAAEGPNSTVVSELPIIPPLLDANVTLSSPRTGNVSVSAAVVLKLFTALPAEGQIVVFFPNFTVAGVSLPSNTINGVDGTVSVSSQGEKVYISRAGSSAVSGSTTVSFTIDDLVNRHWAGDALFRVQTVSKQDNFTIDRSFNVSGATLVQGALVAPSVTFSDRRTGVVQTTLVEFTLSARNTLPSDGLIK